MQTSSFFLEGPCGLLEAVFQAQASKTAVLICHPHPVYGGTMSNKVVTTLASAFYERGYATLRFNFRGVGQSEGQFAHGVGEQQDALAAIAWLTQQGFERILLAGFSFGAYIALAVSQKMAVDSVLLVAPPVIYPEFARLTPPPKWFLITASHDEVISTPAILEWAKRQPAPQGELQVDQASHFFHGQLMALKHFVSSHYPLSC